MAAPRRMGVGDSLYIGNVRFELVSLGDYTIVLRSNAGHEVILSPGERDFIKVDGRRVNIYLAGIDDDDTALLLFNEKTHFLGFSRSIGDSDAIGPSDSSSSSNDACPNCGGSINARWGYGGYCCRGCYEAQNPPSDEDE